MLVDTSVWVEHLRGRNARLTALLDDGQVMMHPFVLGELCCGNLAKRAQTVALLSNLPTLPVLEHDVIMDFVATHRLYGRGLGWIDSHLLASALVAHVPIWSFDRQLASAAQALSRMTLDG
jgi:predicted nucleic acid-binding protein